MNQYQSSIPHHENDNDFNSHLQNSSSVLFNYPGKRQKPQISSVPGVPITTRDRYQVVSPNGEILGSRLTIEEAIELSKGGEA